ncbi:prostatic acid phosphatase-like isoform X2 [Varroa jacobsoni]|uniref:prostatic acid phosphatase-like isoform X2 n=1 Tax=Varroa jacobsoni TaxID=62625 RepID=UPI000BF4B4C7|nr:prostatic acid phosphatase-like isoform X2 [Varroa jacobsoni]
MADLVYLSERACSWRTNIRMIASIVFVYEGFKETLRNSESLRQIHVLFRHAERTPTALYPTDPNKPSEFTEGLGRITIEGKKHMYRMGNQLRIRYKDFLTFDTNEIKARSSGRDRCIESMQTMVAALYEPRNDQKFEPRLAWQPVPIASMPVDIDGMLYEDATCQKDNEAIEELRSTGQGKEVMAKYKDLMENLEKNSGKKMNDWVSVRDLLDTLTIESNLGLKIPKWADSETLKQMEDCAKYATLLNYQQDQRIRFRAGLLLKDVVMHFDDVVNNSPKHKIYAYASHDVLIAAYLSAFGVFNGLPVPSSTAVIIELHESTPGQFYIQMFFRNNTQTGELLPLLVSGCTLAGCQLPVWKKKIEPFIPEDWRKECGEVPFPVPLYDSH